MRIRGKSDAVFFSTVRISCELDNNQVSRGTGFYFLDDRSEKQIPFLVSNKHVVEFPNLKSAELRFNLASDNDRTQPLDRRTHSLKIAGPVWNSRWFGHPDPSVDVAVMVMDGIAANIYEATKLRPHASLLLNSVIPTAEQEKALGSQEPVAFVGYPNGLWDELNNMPIARRGHTATPVFIDFEGKSQFLIDASVFGGSSGSPVFIMDSSHVSPEGTMVMGERFYLLGLVSSVFYRSDVQDVYPAPIPTGTRLVTSTDHMLDIGIVEKARTITETIDFGHKNGMF